LQANVQAYAPKVKSNAAGWMNLLVRIGAPFSSSSDRPVAVTLPLAQFWSIVPAMKSDLS
jgi:hypothetical protein